MYHYIMSKFYYQSTLPVYIYRFLTLLKDNHTQYRIWRRIKDY